MRADWDCKLIHIRHAHEADSMQCRIVGSAIETMPAAGKRNAGALTVGSGIGNTLLHEGDSRLPLTCLGKAHCAGYHEGLERTSHVRNSFGPEG